MPYLDHQMQRLTRKSKFSFYFSLRAKREPSFKKLQLMEYRRKLTAFESVRGLVVSLRSRNSMTDARPCNFSDNLQSCQTCTGVCDLPFCC